MEDTENTENDTEDTDTESEQETNSVLSDDLDDNDKNLDLKHYVKKTKQSKKFKGSVDRSSHALSVAASTPTTINSFIDSMHPAEEVSLNRDY